MLEGAIQDPFGVPAAIYYEGVINDLMFSLQNRHRSLVELYSRDEFVSFSITPPLSPSHHLEDDLVRSYSRSPPLLYFPIALNPPSAFLAGSDNTEMLTALVRDLEKAATTRGTSQFI